MSHHVLLAHAKAVAKFRSLFPPSQKERFIGINLNSEWAEPLDASDPKDVAAAQRYLDAQLGELWFFSLFFFSTSEEEFQRTQKKKTYSLFFFLFFYLLLHLQHKN